MVEEHIEYVTNKAKKSINSISKILHNMQKKRLVYNAVFESIQVLGKKNMLNQHRQCQQQMALRKCMGYRMVSYFSACFIAGIIAIEPLVEKRALSYRNNEGQKERQENSINKHQTL
ncbi:hypothetical protein HHI36_016757 [Cryptolaemus montrouzieri]|uniref:Transmembrane protein n=1 Tax=Cryptolaemus montrouzieri TaxID=559131 RepID=A0ABD2NL39_9CUCU